MRGSRAARVLTIAATSALLLLVAGPARKARASHSVLA